MDGSPGGRGYRAPYGANNLRKACYCGGALFGTSYHFRSFNRTGEVLTELELDGMIFINNSQTKSPGYSKMQRWLIVSFVTLMCHQNPTDLLKPIRPVNLRIVLLRRKSTTMEKSSNGK